MKSYKHLFSRLSKSLAAMVLLLSLSSWDSVSARHVHHYRVRIHRVRRNHQQHRGRHSAIRLRRKKHTKRAPRLNQRQSNHNCYELYHQTIKDINNDRQHYHLPKLRIDHRLSQIGNVRSHQLETYFSHNTKQHPDEADYLLSKRHIKYRYYAENIAASPLGTIQEIAVGSYNTPTDASHNTLVYHSKNGYQLANNINNASMYHDQGDDNGHRINILGKQYKRIGIGASYNTHDRNYYLAIEFID